MFDCHALPDRNCRVGEKTKVTSELLAKSTGCNAAAIRSILNTLQKAGIISIVRGIGGAHLIRNLQELSMWEIYRTLEPEGLKHFIGIHPNPSSKCPVGQQIRKGFNLQREQLVLTPDINLKKINRKELTC